MLGRHPDRRPRLHLADPGHATSRNSYRRTRLAIGASLGLIGLDAAMLTALLIVTAPFIWQRP